MTGKYVVGVDYGTLSGRALVVRVEDGKELAGAVHPYRHAVLTESLPSAPDRSLPPDWALQVPSDYVDVLRHAVPEAVAAAGVDPADVIGIATDFTACTMVPTSADGTPLNELPQFVDRPHAYVKLWKHHAAQGQADRINELAAARGETWLPRYGGLISSEWEFAKALQILEEDREVYDAMDRWVEAADWIIWQLSGTYVRNACSAGYKGILQDDAYPDNAFLAALNPDFADFVDAKLDQPIGQLGECAGTLTAAAAAWTGLREGIAVAVGNVGAHGLVALDWHNGNRSVLVDHEFSGIVIGQTLATRPEGVYRALIEATAFGTRTIIEAFNASDVPVDELIIAGGLSKNPLLMQIYADVTRLPLSIVGSEQGPALGSAIHAAVAAGAYADIRAAAKAMGSVQKAVFVPDETRALAYDELFADYTALHDYFGRGGNDVMHRLRAGRRRALASGVS